MNEGSVMPQAEPLQIVSAVLPHFATPNLEPDRPGQLSAQGIRHDSDHDDINSISILPTGLEIQSERAKYLPSKDPRNFHLGG